jgi:chromate transporter
MNPGMLLNLAGYFAMLSMLSFGGVSASLPEIHRYFVDQQHWMTSEQFTRLFGIANAAPGPNMMVVGLLGFQMAGAAGAVVSFGAMALPSSLFAYYVGGVWHRFRDRPWRIAIQAGLVPLTVGLLLASGYVLTLAADGGSWVAYVLSGATVVLMMGTRLHPLWCLGVGAVLGALGCV